MSILDVQSLLAPISPDDPAGPDLEYDQAFVDLEEAARGQPEQQFGSTIVPAQEPDWPIVEKRALEVLKRSRDLRAAVHLLHALTHRRGLEGLAEGLALLRGLLERFWDGLHPRLDPEDDLDPTTRVNILSAICAPAFVMSAVRLATILNSRLAGRITLREVQIARGLAPPSSDDDRKPLTLDEILAAAADLPPEEVGAVAERVERAVADLDAIETFVTAQVGTSFAMSFDTLAHALGEIRSLLAEARGGVGAETGMDSDGGVPSSGGGAGAASAPAARGPSGEIASRDDVMQAIDRIVAYYKRHEPASPVPLLLLRARRLVNLGFMDILADLAPDAVPQASQITGATPSDPV